MKKLILITGLAAIAFCFNACAPMYVNAIPLYSEGARPESPSIAHIWMEGDWEWNRTNHGYTHHDGSWAIPAHGRTYSQGHWQTTPRGNHWVHSHWQ